MTLSTNGFISFAGTVINCASLSYDPAQSIVSDSNGGAVGVGAVAMLQAMPKITFTTKDIAGLITEAGTIGKGYATACDAYFLQTDETTIRKTTSTKITFAKSLLTIDAVNAAQGGYGTITGTLHFLSADGTTGPTINTAATFTAPTAITTLATVGILTVDGAQVPGVQSASLNLNTSAEIRVSDGFTYPMPGSASIIGQAPTASFTLADSTLATAKLPVDPIGTGISFTLKSVAAGVVSGTYKTFTGAVGSLVAPGAMAGEQGSVSQGELSVTFVGTATTGGITVS
jgi:hypothetical protein